MTYGNWDNLTFGQWGVVALVLLILVIAATIDYNKPWGGIKF